MIGYVGRRVRSEPEVNSGVPLAVTFPVQQPMSIEEMIRKYVREAVSPQAEEQGDETFEEADDFEVEDDELLPMTHHEVIGMDADELAEAAAHYGIDLVDDPAPGQVPQEGPPNTDASPQPQTASVTNGISPQAPQEVKPAS